MRLGGVAITALAACSGVHSGDAHVVASGLREPADVAVAPGAIYVLDRDPADSTSYRAHRITAGGDEVVAHSEWLSPLVADAAGAYWIDIAGGCTVMALPVGADAPIALGRPEPVTSSCFSYQNVASDAEALYVAMSPSLWRVPRSGTGPTLLATIATMTGAVATDQTGVWVATLHGAVHVTPDGIAGPELVLATDGDNQPLLVSDAGNVYASIYPGGFETGSIVRAAADGSRATLVSGLTNASPFIGLGGTLYYASAPAGTADYTIWRASESAGDPEDIADVVDMGGLALDADAVYWTDSRDGTVMRQAR